MNFLDSKNHARRSLSRAVNTFVHGKSFLFSRRNSAMLTGTGGGKISAVHTVSAVKHGPTKKESGSGLVDRLPSPTTRANFSVRVGA